MASKFLDILAAMPDGWGIFRPTVIHPSSAGYPTCPRLYMYKARLAWGLPVFLEAPKIGRVFHKAQELIGGGLPVDVAISQTLGYYMDRLEQARSGFLESHPEGPVPDIAKARKAITLGATLAKVFNAMFPTLLTWDVVVTEHTLRMSLRPLDIEAEVEGTLDAVILDTIKSEYWLVDHKSVGISPSEWSRFLTFDVQHKLYRALWDNANPRMPLVGVIHNIIQKPAIRQKRDESFEEYVSRYYAWFEEASIQRPNQPAAIQSYVRFTDPPLTNDLELKHLLRGVAPLTRCAPSLHAFPRCGRALSGCIGFSGACPYYKLCQSHPVAWHTILTTNGFTKGAANDDPTEPDIEAT